MIAMRHFAVDLNPDLAMAARPLHAQQTVPELRVHSHPVISPNSSPS